MLCLPLAIKLGNWTTRICSLCLSYSIADIPLPASMVIGCDNMFESWQDPFVRRHEKLKGPKGLSQKVRDTAVIHNQAFL